MSKVINSQKLVLIPSIKGEIGCISTARHYTKNEFQPTIPEFQPAWKLELILHKKLSHVFGLEQSALGNSYKVTSKFFYPPYPPLLGVTEGMLFIEFNHLILSYGVQFDGKRPKGFLFKSKIRFNWYAGLGYSFNRSKRLYQEQYKYSSTGVSVLDSYIFQEAYHYRDGFGVFLKGQGGFDFLNKKGKKIVTVNLYFNQGLKTMVHYIIHYKYGFFNDPQKQIEVFDVNMKSKGTTFGISFGVPITILK